MSSYSLNTPRDGHSTPSLGSPFQSLTTLVKKKFPLTSNLNLPWCCLMLCPLTLSKMRMWGCPVPREDNSQWWSTYKPLVRIFFFQYSCNLADRYLEKATLWGFFPLGYSWSFYFLQNSAKSSLGWQSSIAIFCDTKLTVLPNRPWTWNSYNFILILPKHPKILLLPHSLCKEDTQRALLSLWLRGNGCLQFLLYQHWQYSYNKSIYLVFSKSSSGK